MFAGSKGRLPRVRQEGELLEKLGPSLAAMKPGFTATPDWPAGVVILSNGRYRGIWHWKGEAFTFTPGGYGAATQSVATAHDAVSYTLEHVCR